MCLMSDHRVGPRLNLRETVKSDVQEPMKIDCLNLTSVNSAILNLKREGNENWADLASICYNTAMIE